MTNTHYYVTKMHYYMTKVIGVRAKTYFLLKKRLILLRSDRNPASFIKKSREICRLFLFRMPVNHPVVNYFIENGGLFI
jgi:hypothetical protein